jgi:hypothetical protein
LPENEKRKRRLEKLIQTATGVGSNPYSIK